MHNTQSTERISSTPITQWVSTLINSHLPYSTSCANKIVREIIEIKSKDSEMIDSYSNYYHPYKVTTFDENIAYQISYYSRSYTPTFRINFSPFEPGRRHDRPQNNLNPSLTGKSSTSSTTSSTSSSDEDNKSGSDSDNIDPEAKEYPETSDHESFSQDPVTPLSISSALPRMKDTYGFEIQEPSQKSLDIYKRYYEFHKLSTKNKRALTLEDTITSKEVCIVSNINQFKNNCSREVTLKPVSNKSIQIYANYVNSVDNIIYGKSDAKTLDLITNYVKLHSKN